MTQPGPAALLLATCLAAAGCSGGFIAPEAAPPADAAPVPGPAAAAAPAAAAGASPAAAGAIPAVAAGAIPAVAAGAVPAVAGASSAAATGGTLAAAAPATAPALHGELTLAPALREKVRPGATVFVMARAADTHAMVAVAKLVAPATFPLAFTLVPKAALLDHGAYAGTVVLSARVDQDGDPMTKQPGDAVATREAPTAIPAAGLTLQLDRLL